MGKLEMTPEQQVREMLGQRGIKPENLPSSEDIRKLKRRVKKGDIGQWRTKLC